MYILRTFPALIPGLLLMPVLGGLFWDNILRLSEDPKYKPLVWRAALSIVGLFLFGGIAFAMLLVNIRDSLRIASEIILPTLLVLLIFWRQRESFESRSLSRKDVFAGILYGLLLLFFMPISLISLEGVQTVLVLIFPGLTGLWLSTKISTHTWRFFAANIILSLLSLTILTLVGLLFSAQ